MEKKILMSVNKCFTSAMKMFWIILLPSYSINFPPRLFSLYSFYRDQLLLLIRQKKRKIYTVGTRNCKTKQNKKITTKKSIKIGKEGERESNETKSHNAETRTGTVLERDAVIRCYWHFCRSITGARVVEKYQGL